MSISGRVLTVGILCLALGTGTAFADPTIEPSQTTPAVSVPSPTATTSQSSPIAKPSPEVSAQPKAKAATAAAAADAPAVGGPGEYQYDAAGRLVGLVHNGSQAARYSYDNAGNITGVSQYAATQLAVVSIVPASARPGASVVLHGSGFPATGVTVSFNGTAGTVTEATATALTVTVPAAVTSGAVSVTAAGTTIAGPTFTVAPAGPAIESLTPTTGVAGTTVVLAGSGFSADRVNDVVTFDGVRAEVSAATAASLTVVVPLGAGSGAVQVATPAGDARWSGDFVVPPSGVDPALIESSRRIEVGSAPTAVPVATSGQVALVFFDAPASGRLNLGFAASTFGGYITASLRDARGKEIDSYSSSSVFQIDAAGLRPGATLQLVIDPSSTFTGQVTVTVSTPQTSVLSTTEAGSAVTFSRAGQDLAGTLVATPGQRMSVNVSANTLTGYSYLSVLRPDGTTLIDDSYVGTAGAATVRFVAPMSGTYLVVLDPTAAASGSLTLTASLAVAAGTLTATDTGLVASLARPGQEAMWTFAGTAGQSADLGLSANTVASYAYVDVIAPDGSVYVNDHYVSSSASDFVALDTLPASGTYQVLFQPSSAAIGAVTLTYSLQVDVGTVTTTSATSAVTIGRPGQGAMASFAATADQPLSLALSGNTVTQFTYVDVYAPDGSKLVSSRYVSANSDGVLRLKPKATGIHIVRIRPNYAATGSFSLTLSDRSPVGTLTTSGASIQATITRPGQEVAYSLTAAAGDTLNLGLSTNTFTRAFYVWLLDASGTAVGSSTYVSAGAKPAVRLPAITAAGSYLVLLQSDYAATGSITATLSTELAISAAVDGAGVPVSITRPGQYTRISVPNAPAGADLTVALTGDSLATFTYIDLIAPSGVVTSNAFYLGSTDTRKALFLPSPSVAGTYTLLIKPDAAVTGGFTLNASSAVVATPVVGGATSTVTTTKPGQQARLQFSATAGDSLSVGLTSNTLSAYTNVTLIRPDGSKVTQSFVSATTNGDFDFIGLPQTGSYALLFQPSDTVFGSFVATLSAEQALGAITVGGATVPVTIARAGQNARLNFAGTSGQVLKVAYSGNTSGATIGIWVYAPDGTVFLNNRLVSGTSGSFNLSALTATGTYQLLVDPYNATTATVSLALTTVSTAAVARAESVPPAGTLTPTITPTASAPTASTPIAPVADRTSTSAWRPDAANLRGQDWVTRRTPVKAPANLKSSEGITAVSGHVLTLAGKPLAAVSVTAGDITTRTDPRGRFLLRGVSPATKTIVVDGATASQSGARYGLFRIKVDVRVGRTTALPATVWMPRLDTKHTTRIAAPTTSETILTTPEIPGLQVRIPAGSVVRDLKGKVVTELGITPIPIDRTPYPLPTDGIVPVFFTVQPGGAAVFPKGAQIIYPNYTKLPPGQSVDFWNYDPKDKGWYVYGHGRVSADAQQVVPDAKTRVWVFDGAMFNTSSLPPWLTSRFKDIVDWLSGDPVDLSTGRMVDHRTDLAVDDVMPISVSRTLWQGDTYSREFGIGQIADYGLFLHSENQYQEVDLYVPGGGKIHYVRTSAGTGYTDAEFEARNTSSEFRSSTIKWYSPVSGWELTLSDGTRYRFPMYSRATSILDRNGNQITLTRASGNGDLTQITSPNGRWIKMIYDTSGRMTKATDNSGRFVSYTYDSGGRLSTVTDVAGHVSTYTYDANGRIQTIKDGRGIVYLTNEYDANGRVSKQTLPGGAIYAFAYTLDGSGAVTETRVTQPNGSIRRVLFSSSGVPTSDTAAYGTSLARTTTYTRGTDQRISAVTDPFGRQTSFGFDAAGRVTTVKDLAGTADELTTSTITYGPFDEPATVADAAGKVTQFDYDASGNVTSSTDPEGRVQKFTWTLDGQVATSTDPGNRTTTYGYRAGDLVSVTDPLGRVSRQFVDAVGRVVTATDPAGNTSSLTYDAQNEPTKVTDPLGASTSFEYDENGNLTKLTDPRLKALSWAYDAADQVQTATDQLGRTTSYDYDTAGRPTSVTSRAGRKTTFGYDALDRPSTISYGVTSAAIESSATFGYDAFDRPHTVTDTASGTVTMGYDVRDRLTSVVQAQGTVNYGYDVTGRQTSATVGGQSATTYGYDTSGLLTSVTQGTAAVALGYTPTGQPGTTTLPGGWTQANAYDDAGRLTGITYANAGTTKGTISYGYDASGQISTVGGTMANVQLPTARTGLVYDDANRLTSAGGTALTYDDDGNLTNDGSAAYAWDARGNLKQVSKTGLAASFGYDPLGDRSARTVNGTTTGFLNDGANPAAELDSSNAATSSLLSGGVDEWFARTKAGTTDTVLTDVLGSPIALGSADGTLAARYGYDPFGAPTSTGTTRGADLSYTGRQDDGTGLLYYRDRYYSPTLQRFISEDPVGVAGGTNLYAYTGNNPTNATDPSGDNPLLIGCAVGALTDGGISYLSQRLSGRKVDWGSVGGAAVEGCAFGMIGGVLGELGGAGRAASRLCNCFPAGTTVETDQGAKPIEDVEVGDRVWAKDLDTGTPELRRVTGLFDKPTDELIDLDVGGIELQVTPDHPLWVEGTGWTEAGDLKAGDRLADRQGGGSVVRSVDRHPASTRVYNFQVEGDEDYYVTGAQLLVHNCAIKPVNLPAWRTIDIDLEHILSGHTVGGSRVSPLKDLFTPGMTSRQIERVIRQAYRRSRVAGPSQPDRVFLSGIYQGVRYEMWVNKVTRQIESAWPKY